MADHPMMKRAYHVEGGPKEMYVVDANAAVALHPDEWSWEPWPAKARDDYRAKVQADHKKATEEAKAAGLPPPPPPVLAPVVVPTPEEKHELDADAKARAAAAELVRAAEEKERKQREEDEKVAAAKALLRQPPPQIDPEARRPPGRPSNADIAARAAAEKQKADAEKAAADKKRLDQEADVVPAKK